MRQKEAAQIVGQKSHGCVVVCCEPHNEALVAAKDRHGFGHAGDLPKDFPSFRSKPLASERERKPARQARHKLAARFCFQVLEPNARCRWRNAALRSRTRKVARVGNGKKDAEVRKVDMFHRESDIRCGMLEEA